MGKTPWKIALMWTLLAAVFIGAAIAVSIQNFQQGLAHMAKMRANEAGQ